MHTSAPMALRSARKYSRTCNTAKLPYLLPGVLRGLYKASALSQVGVLAGVSGGFWATSVYSFARPHKNGKVRSPPSPHMPSPRITPHHTFAARPGIWAKGRG